ncbi:UNVERIFIED_CONTAM: hypothetical protein FKN15_035061 [Acipenser sinensis]
MVMTFILRHRITGEGLKDFLSILNLLFPAIIPATKYLFDKHFIAIKDSFEMHFYCESCMGYVCKMGEEVDNCPECHDPFTNDSSLNKGLFMIYLPLSSQLKDVLENHVVAQKLIHKSAWAWDETIRDIFDGDIMKDYIQHGKIGEWDLSLLWNSDGVPVFESSECSIWPIQVTVNELPPDIRKDHVLLSSLWFGSSKPVLQTYLRPLIEEMELLKDRGLQWMDGDIIRTSRVFAVVSACDAVARPMLKNSTQFNGKHGCDWCLHPGERVAKGKGFVNVYPYDDPPPSKRHLQQWEDDAIEASREGRSIRGVKGLSPLLFLPYFNIITGFVPDYMHAVLLGVVRQFMTLWLDSSYHSQPWYIGTRRELLDSRLLAFKPPKEVTRTPSSLGKIKFWKASELKNWLLYYSLFVLQGVLPSLYFNHWFLLVYAIYTLLMTDIPRASVEKADLALHKFVILVDTLYGREHVSFNVHQLTHLADSVKLWGPLWCISAFTFESNNHNLMLYFNGTQCVPEQICQKFLLWRDIPRRMKTCMVDANPLVFEYCNRLIGNKLTKKHLNIEGIHIFGAHRCLELSARQLAALKRCLDIYIRGPVKFFKRFSVHGILFTSTLYTRMQKRINSVAMLRDGTFVSIEHLLLLRLPCQCVGNECPCVEIPFVLGHPLGVQNRSLFKDRQLDICVNFVFQVTESNQTIAFPASSLWKKCVSLKKGDTHFLIPIVNTIETD